MLNELIYDGMVCPTLTGHSITYLYTRHDIYRHILSLSFRYSRQLPLILTPQASPAADARARAK